MIVFYINNNLGGGDRWQVRPEPLELLETIYRAIELLPNESILVVL